MLPIHSRDVSGVSSDLQDRVSFRAAVREISSGSAVSVKPASKAPANDLADDVKRDMIDPDPKDDGSDNQTVSYDMVAKEVNEEEKARQEGLKNETNSKAEEIKHKPPFGLDFTTPSVIVSHGAPNRAVAKLFLKAAHDSGHRFSHEPLSSTPKQNAARVDVTI
ncbi:MAG: hypothetical protein HQL69_15085 [Magnetococcales bacterium]|nr:hypothetical protein [Magnetococcales bacterium]